MREPRIEWIDIGKGLCIVLVVMLYAVETVGHSAGSEGWLHRVEAFARPFRMPDFFLLSGLLLSRVIRRDWLTYLDRKVLHFAYFYVLWLTILLAFEARGIARASGWEHVAEVYAQAFVRPYAMLWFIYLLPIFFVVTKLLRAAPPPLVWCAAALLQVAAVGTGVKVLDKFAAYYVFFYSGYLFAPAILRLAGRVALRPRAAGLALGAWAIAHAAVVASGAAPLPGVSLALAFLGCAAVVAASVLMSRLRAFDFMGLLGRRSIVIYLSFLIPLEVTRKLLFMTGWIGDVGTLSLIATVAGVGGALLVHAAVRGGPLGFLFERPAWLALRESYNRAFDRTRDASPIRRGR